MLNTREEVDGEFRYTLNDADSPTRYLAYRWATTVPTELEPGIVALMRDVTASAPIIGFGKTIADAEAHNYIRELRENLAAGKCLLLTIFSGERELIGLCTLRRNLNPNNKHLTDLAKGMIAERFRGGMVLPAAFYEICTRCEKEGADVLTLDVRAETPAHKVWTKLGFQTYGVLDDYARVDGKVHAGHFMKQPVAELKARVAGIMEAAAAKQQRAAAA